VSTDTVQYFAFGANMARRVLVDRRGIVPLASCAARLDGYALRFALRGLPLVEPAFASIVEAPGDSMFGVLHTLRAADLARLDTIEGPYDRVDVEVSTASGVARATAYRARKLSAEREPSKRYLQLLIEGAREHDLPEPWIAELARREGTHLRFLSPTVESLLDVGERLLATLRGRRR
jgi:hypothetical protein